MKAKSITFIIIGILLLIFQVLLYLASIIMHWPLAKPNNIPRFIGFNVWAVLGIAFLFLAYKVHRNFKRKKEKEELESFLINDIPSKHDSA